MEWPVLTGAMLRDALALTTDSSAGLDQWRYSDLVALSAWCPTAFDALAGVLRTAELHALVPKSDMPDIPGAADYRPITVLSQIYHLWAKCRLVHVTAWQAHWLPDGVFGVTGRPGADALAIKVAQEMAGPASDAQGAVALGISYDFRKCFDLLPIHCIVYFACVGKWATGGRAGT
eukprot:6000339-Amphidinium_carterae.1